VDKGTDFSLDVYVNSGDQKLAAYGIVVSFVETIVEANTAIGNKGVEAGPDGFISAISTDGPGTIVISGFDIDGTGPGSTLHIVTINFSAVDTGSSAIGLSVDSLVDEDTDPIGTPTGVGGNVEVIEGK
jgi:hypothetical protein